MHVDHDIIIALVAGGATVAAATIAAVTSRKTQTSNNAQHGNVLEHIVKLNEGMTTVTHEIVGLRTDVGMLQLDVQSLQTHQPKRKVG